MSEAVTVVTGSSRGIGRFLAEHYLELGHRVIGCSRSGCGPTHDRYDHATVNVGDEREVTDFFRSIGERYGTVDNLINNAGIASMNHALLTPASTLDRVMNTNVSGTFLCSREAAKLMQRRRYGRIVVMTSVAVPWALAGEAAYVASKSAVAALAQVLARELACFGITVNTVGPTPMDTDMTRGVPAERIEELVGRQTIARVAQPGDVCNVVDFFLKRESGMVTGQTVYLGGAA